MGYVGMGKWAWASGQVGMGKWTWGTLTWGTWTWACEHGQADMVLEGDLLPRIDRWVNGGAA